MEDCERLERCPFFRNIKCLPRTAEQLANSYCRGDNSGCARRWVLSAGERPPDDLFPNERDRALRIVSESKAPNTVVGIVSAKKTSRKP